MKTLGIAASLIALFMISALAMMVFSRGQQLESLQKITVEKQRLIDSLSQDLDSIERVDVVTGRACKDTTQSRDKQLSFYDRSTGITFLVESNGVNLVAIKCGNVLWNTNPAEGWGWYREPNPKIRYLGAISDRESDDPARGDYLGIAWSNSRFGRINKFDGRFEFQGQD